MACVRGVLSGTGVVDSVDGIDFRFDFQSSCMQVRRLWEVVPVASQEATPKTYRVAVRLSFLGLF